MEVLYVAVILENSPSQMLTEAHASKGVAVQNLTCPKSSACIERGRRSASGLRLNLRTMRAIGCTEGNAAAWTDAAQEGMGFSSPLI